MQGGCCARRRRDVLGQGGEEGVMAGGLKSGGALDPSSGTDGEVAHVDLFEEVGWIWEGLAVRGPALQRGVEIMTERRERFVFNPCCATVCPQAGP